MKMRVCITVIAAAIGAGSGQVLAQSDFCETPEPITGFGSFPFDTTAATPDGAGITCAAGSANSDVWFCWTASKGGPVIADLCAGDVSHDSVVVVYAGCGCPAGGEIACNDDSCGLQSSVSFLATAGETYMIRVGGFSPAAVGPGTLRIQSGIVFTTEFNGSTYHLFAANTWGAANEIAESLGGTLVAINDQAENDFVQLSVLAFDGADRRAWLGLTDQDSEGSFQWTSGDAVKYTNWSAGEPNDFGGNEDYTEMLGGNGQWNDQPDSGNGFVRFGVAEVRGDVCTADFNNDDQVNSQDFFDFLSAFFAEQPSADFNNDDQINSQDFFDFLSAFFVGC